MSFAGTLAWSGLGTVDTVRVGRHDVAGSGQAKPDRNRSASLTSVGVGGGSREHPRSGGPVERVEERRLDADWGLVVARCLHGDSAAWAELVKTHHRRVYTLCYRFTGSPHDSEDLTQEVFLKIYGNLASFDLTRGSFQTWITTLTRNLLVDHFRRSRQQRVTDSIDAGWDDSGRAADVGPAGGQQAHAARSGRHRARSKEWCRKR